MCGSSAISRASSHAQGICLWEKDQEKAVAVIMRLNELEPRVTSRVTAVSL